MRALVDFVDRGVQGRETAAALAHLDRCRQCTTELELTAQMITALRRIGAEAARIEPPANSWAVLRDHLQRMPARRTAPRPWHLRLSGSLVSALIVAMAFASSGTRAPFAVEAPPGDPTESAAHRAQEARAEAALISDVGVGNRFSRAPEGPPPGNAGIAINYPDGLRPNAKEVSSKRSDRWLLRAT
jgi:anti-sigma factor RsiW